VLRGLDTPSIYTLLMKVRAEGGTITASKGLTIEAFEEARREGRLYVCDDGHGYVWWPTEAARGDDHDHDDW
jgi:hypothetical protein